MDDPPLHILIHLALAPQEPDKWVRTDKSKLPMIDARDVTQIEQLCVINECVCRVTIVPFFLPHQRLHVTIT